MKIVALLIVLFLVPLTASAQDFCEGNFDCDQDVDGTDAAVFKQDFGRSPFSNPCPTCQENPCPCPECAITTCGIDDFVGVDICLLSGVGGCCCCVPIGNPYLSGLCTDIDTCFNLQPHPIYGPYECLF